MYFKILQTKDRLYFTVSERFPKALNICLYFIFKYFFSLVYVHCDILFYI